MKKIFYLTLFCCFSAYSQMIENPENISRFKHKILDNKNITKILFLGDSHIQAGFLSNFLKNKFQEQFGNAGRGLVFPYQIANSSGPDDFTSVSNQAWKTFRTVYEQDVFSEMGASGFVMGNNENSLIEIKFNNPNDAFNEVVVFCDDQMKGDKLISYCAKNGESLSKYTTKSKKIVSYRVQKGETYPELAAKFNVVTTRLKQLNGDKILNPKEGMMIKAEKVDVNYNAEFENYLTKNNEITIENNRVEINYPKPTQNFLLASNAKNGNIFYGFQFLNGSKNGVLFNTVGVNGATYGDFMKYPLQLKQLETLKSDLVMISLGTNESLSKISKSEFKDSAVKLINKLRNNNPDISILLISPTDNKLSSKKIVEVVSWIKEIASEEKTAFINQYENMGGTDYFSKALSRKEANADGVHFLKTGYESQAEKIWQAFREVLK